MFEIIVSDIEIRPTVVFCTTETDMSYIEQAIEYGAQEFIMKPFDEEILIGKFTQAGLQ